MYNGLDVIFATEQDNDANDLSLKFTATTFFLLNMDIFPQKLHLTLRKETGMHKRIISKCDSKIENPVNRT